MEGVHVGVSFRIGEGWLDTALGLHVDRPGLIECWFFTKFVFDSELTQTGGFLGSIGVLSDGAVSDWAVGRALPQGFKHDNNKINKSEEMHLQADRDSK